MKKQNDDVFSIETIEEMKRHIEKSLIVQVHYTLVFSRPLWEAEREIMKCFNFTDEELDKAEKHPVGLIGKKGITECYLAKSIELPG